MVQINLNGTYKDTSLRSLLLQLYKGAGCERIDLDLSSLKFLTSSAMAALIGVIRGWEHDGKEVYIAPPCGSSCLTYMQRMNFYRLFDIEMEEPFTRRDPSSRFVPFECIKGRSSDLADLLGQQIAACIAPEEARMEVLFSDDDSSQTGFYDGIVYSVSELVKNVQQHSKGTGVIGAQYYPSTGLTEIAIADVGVGIHNSFIESGSPLAAKMKNDAEALELAIQPEVSSKTHLDVIGLGENRGVGLSLLTWLATHSGGSYVLASGQGFLTPNSVELFPCGSFPGTFVCMSFKRSSFAHFQNMLENAKRIVLGEDSVIPNRNIEELFL